ncbi:hypothetical protein ANCDUO_14633 [Ancylostoma duodenale]|uniref:Uncharacterized protein n=1 Tax=Ancylostoma duodenale TaxID=51022 RepID=A0A0C2G8M8_9BILA|nr:hypothetical protein ANCDUO_14633 [Ancylostoma duodenale]
MPSRTAKRNNSVAPKIPSETNGSNSVELVEDSNFSAMSPAELLKAIFEENSNPKVERMLGAFVDKLPLLTTEKIEEEKRSRSIVIAGLEETPPNSRPSHRQKHLEEKVAEVLDALDLESRPMEFIFQARPITVLVEWTHFALAQFSYSL